MLSDATLSIVSGGNKAKTFEPLAGVVDWLISSPSLDWSKQLRESAQVQTEQSWKY